MQFRKHVLFALLVLVAPASVAAQQRDLRLARAASATNVTPYNVAVSALGGPASTGRLIVGGLLGGGVGFVAGGLAGAFIGNDESSEDGWIRALHGSVIGASIGESLGLAAGVHLANRRQGNLLASSAASLAIGALGTVLVWNYQDPPASPIILTVTPLVQLFTAIAIERR